jgi:hypothetical protein
VKSNNEQHEKNNNMKGAIVRKEQHKTTQKVPQQKQRQ